MYNKVDAERTAQKVAGNGLWLLPVGRDGSPVISSVFCLDLAFFL